jgi:hypothetical protein
LHKYKIRQFERKLYDFIDYFFHLSFVIFFLKKIFYYFIIFRFFIFIFTIRENEIKDFFYCQIRIQKHTMGKSEVSISPAIPEIDPEIVLYRPITKTIIFS